MALRINYNYESVASQRNLSTSQSNYGRAIEQLSSGLRINKAADDAAGLVRGLNQAQRNAQDGISLLQTAEGALNETHSLLGRMRELAVQSANDTLSNSDRLHIQDEVNQLLSEVDRIASSTQFNKINLLNGSASAVALHIGANKETGVNDNEIAVAIAASDTTTLAINTLGTTATITTQSGANSAISALDAAIETISTTRGKIGAYQNRLESTINSLGVATENAGAANSRIRDADVAQSVSEMVRNQILQQSTMAVLAQANQAPQMALQLLK